MSSTYQDSTPIWFPPTTETINQDYIDTNYVNSQRSLGRYTGTSAIQEKSLIEQNVRQHNQDIQNAVTAGRTDNFTGSSNAFRSKIDNAIKGNNYTHQSDHADVWKLRYVNGTDLPTELIGDEYIKPLSDYITETLQFEMRKRGVLNNRPIRVKDDDIRKVITSIQGLNSMTMKFEDIRRNAASMIVSQTLDIYDVNRANQALDPNIIKYTGECGLIAHGPIKLREKKRPYVWMWNY